MVNTDSVRTAVGVIGNVISFGLFLSPLPTFVKIYKTKSVEEFKADLYVDTIQNCILWSFYGSSLVSEDNILVLTINAIGFFIEVFYTLVFFNYSDWNKRKNILNVLLMEAIFTVVVVFVTLHFVHTLKQRTMIIGIICIFFNILTYCYPLTVMRLVIKTKSVKYISFLLSLTNFVNGLIWVIYASFRWDPYLVIPNGLGALSGLIQLILYARYYKSTESGEDRPQFEMSRV